MTTFLRVGADATGGRLAVVEHRAERGLGSPVHRHRDDDETPPDPAGPPPGRL